MILALDTATTTGWAAGVPGGQPRWGVRVFSSEDGGTGQVVSMFRAWLGEMCSRLQPRIIVFESPYIPHPGEKRAMNVVTLRRLISLVETASSVAFERNIRCYEATAGNAAKFMTGKGGRWPGGSEEKKQRVIEACLRYGWDVEGHNDAADALALWALAEDVVARPAAARRRREAADRDRATAGEGPLFKPPEKANAPGSDLPEAFSQPDEMGSSNGRQKNIRAGRKIQPASSDLFRKSA